MAGNREIERKFFEYLPSWAWGCLSVFIALGFVLNTLGLNFAAPLNIIAMAKADAYKSEILTRNLKNSEMDELIKMYTEQHDILKKYVELIERNEVRLRALEQMAHNPGSTKHGH